MITNIPSAVEAARKVRVRVGALQSWNELLTRFVTDLPEVAGDDVLSLVCQLDDADRLQLTDRSAKPGFEMRCVQAPSGTVVVTCTSVGRAGIWQHVVPLASARSQTWLRQVLARKWVSLGSLGSTERMSASADITLPPNLAELMAAQPQTCLQELLPVCTSLRQDAYMRFDLARSAESDMLFTQVLHLPDVAGENLDQLLHASELPEQVQKDRLLAMVQVLAGKQADRTATTAVVTTDRTTVDAAGCDEQGIPLPFVGDEFDA